jgi:hypothetical protein
MKIVVENNTLKAVIPMNLFRLVQVPSMNAMLASFGPIMVLVYQHLEEIYGAVEHAGEILHAKETLDKFRWEQTIKNYHPEEYFVRMKELISNYHTLYTNSFKPNRYIEENFANIHQLLELHESLQHKLRESV